MRTKWLIHLAVVAVPVLVIAGWIGSYVIHVENSATYELPVRGFDPRDLLSGHYLRYQVDYGQPVACPERTPEWCLCLRPSQPFARVNWQGQCSDAACNTPLKGSCTTGSFVAGIERYYFPERYTRELAIVPPASSIIVSVSGSGKGVVKSFIVDGEPLQDWLQSKAVEP